MQLEYCAIAGGAMLYEASLSSEPDAEWFDPQAWRDRDSIVGQAGAGRGSVWFVASADGTWALRHYCRGGLVSRLINDQYLWLGEEQTRAFLELRLLARLTEGGLPVPPPIAAAYRRHGPFYRADLITGYIDAPSFQTLMLSNRLTTATWEEVGRVVRRFHDAGVYHADLNIRNMLVRADGRVFLLDFDKGRLRPHGGWAQQNLDRLQRSIHKICATTDAKFDAAGWRRLLAGYQTS